MANPDPIPDDKESCDEKEKTSNNFDNDVSNEGKLHAVITDKHVTPVKKNYKNYSKIP